MTNNLSPDMFDDPTPTPRRDATIRPAPTAATLRPSAEPVLGLVYNGPTDMFPAVLGRVTPWVNCGIKREFPRKPVFAFHVPPDAEQLMLDGEPSLEDRERLGPAWGDYLGDFRATFPGVKLIAYDALGVQPWKLSKWSGVPLVSAMTYGRSLARQARFFRGFDAIGTDIYLPPGYENDRPLYDEWVRLKVKANVEYARDAGIKEVVVLLTMRIAPSEGRPWSESRVMPEPMWRMQLDAMAAERKRYAGGDVKVRWKLWGDSGGEASILREDAETARRMVEYAFPGVK